MHILGSVKRRKRRRQPEIFVLLFFVHYYYIMLRFKKLFPYTRSGFGQIIVYGLCSSLSNS